MQWNAATFLVVLFSVLWVLSGFPIIRYKLANYSATSSEISSNILPEIQQLTQENVGRFLEKIGLERYCQTFHENKIDGHMLEAIIHPTLGEGLMKSLGITDERDRLFLVQGIYRIKFQGWKN